LLKQTASSTDRNLPLNLGDKNSLVNLGDFQSLLHRADASATGSNGSTTNHRQERAVEISLDWRVTKPLKIADFTKSPPVTIESANLGFSSSVQGESSGAHVMRQSVSAMEYRIGDATFGIRRRDGKSDEYTLFDYNSPINFLRTPGRAWSLPSPGKCYGFPDQVRAYYQNTGFLSDLELALENQLQQVYYLGPLRAYPERTYTWTGAEPSDMGRSGERVIEALLSARNRGEVVSQGPRRASKSVPLEAYVAEWLKKLELISEFRVETVSEGSQIFSVKVRKTSTSPEVLITDVGFGVSQILPVIVLCFYAPEGSTIILEQPEIHLHPAIQSGLADVIIDACKKRKIQVILESHSEHILRRFQLRMAEGALTQEQVAMYFSRTRDSESYAEELQLDDYGNIANWPPDFFGDQLGEVARTQLARIARQSK